MNRGCEKDENRLLNLLFLAVGCYSEVIAIHTTFLFLLFLNHPLRLLIWITVKGQHRLKLTIISQPGDVEIFWNINDICVATYTNKVGKAVFTFKLG